MTENRSSRWYVAAMEQLVEVVQALSQARDTDRIMAIVRDAARDLTGADGATFVLRDGDCCYYAEENAISPLWKGHRFPLTSCISGWAMLNARAAVIEDIYSDPRIPVEAYRPTFVKSLAMVPIRRHAPIGAIGNYWAQRRLPSAQEVAILQALADTTSVALENVQLYAELTDRVQALQASEARIGRQRDALEVFTHALAHDLREPVRTIREYAPLVQAGAASAEKKEEYLGYVGEAARRMGVVMESVARYVELDDSRPPEGGRCAMGLALEEACAALRIPIEQGGATVRAGALPEVRAEPVQMRRLLQNLIENSVRFGGRGVQVEVSATERADDWLFSVEDDGPGLPPAQRERVFLPFRRVRKDSDGPGLGLTVCRRIVEAHRGTIWCESAPSGGATFRFTLPKLALADNDTPVPSTHGGQRRSESVGDPGGSANVLLVDDDDADVELARMLLFGKRRLQCNVTVARDGRQALDALVQAREDVRFDLAIVDINMPGMDGFELLEAMRAEPHTRELPVVMCTGSTYDRDMARARALGAVGYLVKPPSLDEFRAVLERVEGLRTEVQGSGYRLLRSGA